MVSLELNNIALRQSTGVSREGKLVLDSSEVHWTTEDGKEVKVSREDVDSFSWTPVHIGCELGIFKTDGSVIHLTGLKAEDYNKVKDYASELKVGTIREEQIGTTGQNWGKLKVEGKIVSFSQSENKPIFKIPLPDVSTVQHTKDEVTFEFAAGEMTFDQEDGDCLVGMSFHIPAENEDFAVPEDSTPAPIEDTDQEKGEVKASKEKKKKESPAQRFFQMISPHIDASGKSDLPIGTFHEVTVLVPRGKFEVQLHHAYLKMLGQAQDFKIYYNSILHLFVLPKPNPPTTTVVAALDPPIRKGQTFYNHVLFQYDSDSEMVLELNISQSEIDSLNVKHGGALSKKLESSEFDVFAACLRGLSGARTIRPHTFTNNANDGSCIRCSYKTDEGFLFPLERAFFFIHKPPLCISHDEIDIIEFQRQGTHVVSASTKTFDLCIRTKQGLDHQFRGIERMEWQPLFDFIVGKNLMIENMESARQGPGHQSVTMRFEDMDLGNNNRSNGDTDDSDPDFAMNPNEEQDDDASTHSGDSSGPEVVDEADISEPEPLDEAEEKDELKIDELSPAKITKKEEVEAQSSSAGKKRSKGTPAKDSAKKQRKKKDKNAPKKNLSAYMFYSSDIRASVREELPDISFGEVGKVIGERWKSLSVEEKEKYQEMAQKDKERYAEEKAIYDQKTAETKESGSQAD